MTFLESTGQHGWPTKACCGYLVLWTAGWAATPLEACLPGTERTIDSRVSVILPSGKVIADSGEDPACWTTTL